MTSNLPRTLSRGSFRGMKKVDRALTTIQEATRRTSSLPDITTPSFGTSSRPSFLKPGDGGLSPITSPFSSPKGTSQSMKLPRELKRKNTGFECKANGKFAFGASAAAVVPWPEEVHAEKEEKQKQSVRPSAPADLCIEEALPGVPQRVAD